jgi:hypothetical protein
VALVTRRRSKSEFTIPERASAVAGSLQGSCRLRVNNRRGGGKARNTGVRERNLSINIARNQSNVELDMWNGNFIITVCMGNEYRSPGK